MPISPSGIQQTLAILYYKSTILWVAKQFLHYLRQLELKKKPAPPTQLHFKLTAASRPLELTENEGLNLTKCGIASQL